MTDRERVRNAAEDLFNILRDVTEIEIYKPIRDRVLIRPLAEPEHQTEQGIWVPEEEKEWRSLVMAVGPGIMTKHGKRSTPDVVPGDVVMTGSWIGEPVTLDGEVFRLVRAGDILGVYAEKKE